MPDNPPAGTAPERRVASVMVSSSLLGPLEVEPDKVLTFPGGLLGFDGSRQFVMVEHEDAEVYWWLQDLVDPELTFLTVVPWPFFPDYEPDVDEVHQELLELQDPDEAMVLCLVTIRADDQGDEPPGGAITTNLLGPLVVNRRTRVGAQVVLSGDRWPVRADLIAS
jgi:flagellar assembly factor FliW